VRESVLRLQTLDTAAPRQAWRGAVGGGEFERPMHFFKILERFFLTWRQENPIESTIRTFLSGRGDAKSPTKRSEAVSPLKRSEVKSPTRR
jgi:hypothetical protein